MLDVKIGNVDVERIYIGNALYWERQPQAPTDYVNDDFNRADNTTLGNAITGQTWQYTNGSWGISNNSAYSVSTSNTHKRAIIDSGVSDCEVSVTIATITIGNGTRLLFRYVDASNEWMLYESGKYKVAKRVSGVLTDLYTSAITPLNGDILKAVCTGSNIKCYVNDVLLCDINDSALQTATKHGFEIYTSNISRFDDFTVKPLT